MNDIAKLTAAIVAAKTLADTAIADKADDGTCNLDYCSIFVGPGNSIVRRSKKLDAAMEALGGSFCDYPRWARGYGFSGGGQANTRTIWVHAFRTALKTAGYDAGVVSIID